MRFALIDAKKADIAVETACAVLNVSVSGYYAWKARKASCRQRRDLILLAHIRAQFSQSRETYGSPRMHAELQEAGLCAGRHRVARIMRENHLKARPKMRFKKTTDSDHGGAVAPNVLAWISPRKGPMRNGASISPMSGPPKAGSIWPSCLIYFRAALSAGR